MTMNDAHWQSWQSKLELFDAFGRVHFAAEEREGARLKRRFFDFCRPHGRVLDVGCGTGYNRQFLPSETRYVGIDPLRLAGAERVPFAQAVGEFIPCRSDAVDTAVCIATLDHVADPRLLIRECHRVLRRDGTVAIMSKVEFEAGPLARLVLYARVGLRKLVHGNVAGFVRGLREVVTGHEDEFHMHHFTLDSLHALVVDAGFGDVVLLRVGNVAFLKARKRDARNDRRTREAQSNGHVAAPIGAVRA